MGPIIRHCRDLTLLDLVVRDLTRPVNDWSVIVRRVQDRQGPNPRSARRDQHERAVHQTRGSLALPGLFCEAIPRTVLPATIAA